MSYRFMDDGSGLVADQLKIGKRITDDRNVSLLQAALSAAIQYIEKTPCDPDINDEQILAYGKYLEAKQAAIDAGALETNAYREGYTAGTSEDANKPEPYPPYDIGTDQANDWLRGFRDAGALEGE